MKEPNTSPVPVQSNERIQVIDVLRGFAILGILLFNMRGFSGQAFPASSWPQPVDRIIVILIDFLVQAKFYSLFSFLFGWGMAVQMRRVEAKGKNFFPVYLRRMIILFIFGTLHKSLLWTGDILLMYAVLGIIMLLIFRKLPPKVLMAAAILFLISAILLTLPGETMNSTREWCRSVANCFSTERTLSETLYNTGTYWEVTQFRFQELRNGFWWFPCYLGNVIAMMLLGLYTGKRKLFEEYHLHQDLFRKVMWTGLILGVVLNGYFAYISAYPFSSEYYSLFRIGARTIGAPAMTLFYITGITQLFQQEKWRKRLAPLSLVGRMALTNYISHSLLLPLFFYGYGLGFYGLTDPTFGVIFTLVIYRIQIQFSQWWFERFQFGPLEWLWRTLTYAMKLPFSIEATYDSLKKFSQITRRQWTIILTVGIILILVVGAVFGNRLLGRNLEDAPANQALIESEVLATAQADESTLVEMSAPFTAALEQPITTAQRSGSANPDPNRLLNTFDPDSAFSFIDILSSDLYQGRVAGSTSGRAAGDFIAEQFAQFDLEPVGSAGSFFQSFPLQNLVIDSEPSLTITIQDGTILKDYQMHKDYIPLLGGYSGPGIAEGSVIWAVNCTRQDFHEIDVVGRIVFCRSGDLQSQLRLAVENDAAGLLLLNDQSSQPPDFRIAFLESWIPDPIPVFQIYSPAAADLLTGSGYSVADLSILYEPIDLNATVQMEVEAHPPCKGDICTGRNLLGVIAGYDPLKKDQVIILSANYDGLGMAPDGTIWPGANDNASGVSILLEIARSWQEEGFSPGVTVLFAAWDAREQGHLGLDHFLQNPIYPLENTIAVIQLDQVGAGSEILQINGAGAAGQIQAAAAGIGVETIARNVLSEEAALFTQSGLSYSILGWEGAEYLSQRPEDGIDNILVGRLDQVGKITGLVIFQLSELPAAIADLLSLRCEGIANDDLQTFLNTSTISQAENDRLWFEDVRSLEPKSCEMASSNLLVTGKTARADITLQLEIPPEEEEDENSSLTVRMPVLFKYVQNGWQWDGPQLVRGETASVGRARITVHYPKNSTDQVEGLAQAAAVEYNRIANLLSLSPQMTADIKIYARANLLQADTNPSHEGYISSWASPNSLKFSFKPEKDSEDFLISIAHLLLANHEIPRGSFPWLWEGLPLFLQNSNDQILQQSDKLAQLQNQLAESEVGFTPESSWAAVEYIHKTRGYAGLGRLIENLGSACQILDCDSDEGADLALMEALQIDQASFNAAWTSYWKTRLDSAQLGLDAVLSRRVAAVLSGDETAFLATVDPSIANLLIEETDWFRSLSQTPPDTFQLTGKPVAMLDDGDILAEVEIKYTLLEVPPPLGRANLSFNILFSPDGDDYRWAGPIFQSVWGNNIRVRYPDGFEETANTLLADAERYYEVISNQLRIADSHRLTINLYDDLFLYRSSISPSFSAPDWMPGWTGPGHSIKLLVKDDVESDHFQRALALQLSRQLLMQVGVRDEWTLTGGSCYLLRNAGSGSQTQFADAALIRLMYAINKEAEFDLTELPDLYSLSEDDYQVAIAQSWDAMRYFANEYGDEILIDFLLDHRIRPDLEGAMQSVMDLSTSNFFTAWKDSFLQGHIPDQALDIALQFDVNEAQNYLDFLVDPELAGRQAGSSGSDLAADYIAAEFSKSGLLVEQQYFPVSYQTYLETPFLELSIDGRSSSLIHREDFLVLQLVNGREVLSGDLIWVADEDYSGMDLDGKIAVRRPTLPIREEIANAADHGASALILVHDKNRDLELLAKYPFPTTIPEHEIPVIELTRSGFTHFLEILDQNLANLYNTFPAIPLGAQAQLRIAVSEPEISETSNVIGYLPGSNPELQDEVIIVGAHYDHVGFELGTAYSGINDNASGVAALLEIARLWQEEGYHPGRSIAFIAWGAQEPGELGSQYYISNPVFPLKNTVAVLQLDTIGGGDGYFLEAGGYRDRDGLLLFSMHRACDMVETRLSIADPKASSLPDQALLYSPESLFNSAGMIYTSDDVPFRQLDIPTLLLRWQKASENNLPDLQADPFLPERLEKSGKAILAALMMLAR